MTKVKAAATFLNIAFAIAIWFAVPLVLPTVAALGWVLVIFNFFFSLGIVISIFESYAAKEPQQ